MSEALEYIVRTTETIEIFLSTFGDELDAVDATLLRVMLEQAIEHGRHARLPEKKLLQALMQGARTKVIG